MSQDMEDVKPPPKPGLPPYLATFADLMALLMCFFVLLLSFSQMDLAKFKKIAGSMSQAFGVQRQIVAYEIPKGTSVIAREFSPGKPDPTPLNEIRQKTIEEMRQTLEFDEIRVNGETKGRGEFDKTATEKSEGEISEEQDILEQTAAELAQELKYEIIEGMLEVEVSEQRVIIRILEQGSFASGEDVLKLSFVPVVDKIRKVLESVKGRINIEGHTDDIPIYTSRFRSNWELSAARAVSVAHQLLEKGKLDKNRMSVTGFADTRPLFPNDTDENRANNRRVEIVLNQNDTPEDKKLDQVLKQDKKNKSPQTKGQEQAKPISKQPSAVRSVSEQLNDRMLQQQMMQERGVQFGTHKLFPSRYLDSSNALQKPSSE